MKLSDMVMDDVTHRLLLRARLMAKHPSARALRELKKASDEYEMVHEEELITNLFKALGLEEIL